MRTQISCAVAVRVSMAIACSANTIDQVGGAVVGMQDTRPSYQQLTGVSGLASGARAAEHLSRAS